MGSLALAMPPAARGGRAPATTLLVGDGEEDALRGHQIAVRLAALSGWPVFVACALGGAGGTGGASAAGYDDATQRHAAALAEREVARVLLDEKSIWGR